MADFRYRPPMPDHHRDILHVPESHTLYVCPPGCGRRHALRALKNDVADECSFYFLSQSDVAMGDYESEIVDVVAELFSRLGFEPRVLVLYFNCIDDLLGTDEDAMLARLRQCYPKTRFLVSHIDPIAEDKPDGGSDMQGNVYGLLEPAACHDRAINIIGRFNSLPESTEFYDVVSSWGVEGIRDISSCETYDEYQMLARSALNVVTTWIGEKHAKMLLEKVGTPAFRWIHSYAIETVADNYNRLFSMLASIDCIARKNLSACIDSYARSRDNALEAIARTRKIIGDTPLAVDSLATFKPFSMANALLGYGFNVVIVFGLHIKEDELAAKGELERLHPSVNIIESAKATAELRTKESELSSNKAILAVGNDAATFLESVNCLDMFHDEGCFGFDGITKLMIGLGNSYSNGHATIG